MIETPRLSLRVPELADWPGYRDYMASPQSRYMGGPYAEEAAWGWFCHDVALWQLCGHGALMLVQKNSAAVIGQVAINAGPKFPEREIGWMLYPESQGYGYASEAAEAMLRWAFAQRQFTTLVSYIDPENSASIALARRLGAKLDVSAPRPGTEGDLVYRHSAHRYLS